MVPGLKRGGFAALLLLVMAAILCACAADGNGAFAGSGADGAPVETQRATGRTEAAVASGGQSETAQPASQTEATASGGNAVTEQRAERKTVYPITVEDASGHEFTFDRAPERLVSISPAETEVLFALGLGDRVVGVSDFDNYPEEATNKPRMGGIVQPNEEAILAAAPDLVIGGISMDAQVADRLHKLKLKLYKTDPKKLEDVIDNILRIGVITDTQERAEALAGKMREDVRTVTDAVASLREEEKKRVYIEFAPGWTVGRGEFMDELIGLAGGINIAGDTEGWNQIDEEAVILKDPEVILYAEGTKDFDTGRLLPDIIKTRSGWSGISAIRNDRLVGLDQDMLVRPGPRLTQGLLAIVRALYPERFE